MKDDRLRALGTLAQIRLRRQESLERQRLQEQAALARLGETAADKAAAVALAEGAVAGQVALIARLLLCGNRFQVADYLRQQDYQAWLEAKADAARAEQAQADAAVVGQEQVLQQARAAVARNLARHARLEASIRQIRIDIDVAQMDSDDEQAEEGSILRRKMQATAARAAALEAGCEAGFEAGCEAGCEAACEAGCKAQCETTCEAASEAASQTAVDAGHEHRDTPEEMASVHA